MRRSLWNGAVVQRRTLLQFRPDVKANIELQSGEKVVKCAYRIEQKEVCHFFKTSWTAPENQQTEDVQ